MRLFNSVAIVGTGLIGGSMALDIKKKRLACHIIGVSRHRSTLAWAKKEGIIDFGSRDLNIIKGADLVVLATPVNTILKSAGIIAKIIRKDCVVMDVGSTKKEIVSKLNRIFPNYVGCHPLAGSEKRGIVNIQPGIFRDSLCILTPMRDTNPVALRRIKNLWNQLGARVVFLNPDAHDKVLSFVSHLPHAVAFSLIATMPDKYLKFGANGLKDTTRIALSDSGLWTGILLSNRANMIKAIGSFQNKLSSIKSAINKKDAKALSKILEKAKLKRNSLK